MRVRVLAVVVLLLSVGLLAQEKPASKLVDVSGTWDLTVNSPNGSGSRVLKLRQDGEKLTGEYEGSMSNGTVTGTIREDTIAFTATVSMDSGSFEIRYTGKVDSDKMSGEVDFGEYGNGTWSGAKRK